MTLPLGALWFKNIRKAQVGYVDYFYKLHTTMQSVGWAQYERFNAFLGTFS